MARNNSKNSNARLSELIKIADKASENMPDKHQNGGFSPEKQQDLIIKQPRNRFDSKEYLHKKASNAADLIAKLHGRMSLESEDNELLFSILGELGEAELAIRDAIINKPVNTDISDEKKRYLSLKKISVSIPEHAVLRVTLPPLMAPYFKGSYNIYYDVRTALEQYFFGKEKPRLFGGKYMIIYKRYSHHLDSFAEFDNDNWETKRVTNAITHYLDITDNALNFSFLYTAVKSDEDYCEATVISMDDLPFFTGYIHKISTT